MQQDIYINKLACPCKNPKKICTRSVLESKKKPFKVQRFCTEKEDEQGLHSWDIGIFRHPPHPDFKVLKTVDKMNYIDLDFGSLESGFSSGNALSG